MQIKDKEKVKLLRVRLELTQSELAERAGVSQRTIHMFEKDVQNLRKAKYETLLRLAEALEVEVDDIFLG